MAIKKIALRVPKAFSEIYFRLMKSPPIKRATKPGQRFLGNLPDIGEIDFIVTADMVGLPVIENMFPWLILSQLGRAPLGTDSGARDPHLELLVTDGDFPEILVRSDIRAYKEITGLHVHEIEGGVCLCNKIGVVEPITFAIQRAFYNMLNEMLKVCAYTIRNKNLFLGLRLFAAAKTVQDSVDETIRKIIRKACAILRPLVSRLK